MQQLGKNKKLNKDDVAINYIERKRKDLKLIIYLLMKMVILQ